MSVTAPWGDVFGARRQSLFDWLPCRKPVLVRCASGGELVVGRAVRLNIQTRHARSAELSIRDDEGSEVYEGAAPLVGFISIIPVGTSLMRLRLRLESHRGGFVDYQLTMKAKAVPPVLSRARAPSRVRVGETIPVSWRAGSAVTVDIEGCGFSERRSGHGEGAFVLRPEQAGVMVLKFTAADRYGASIRTRIVKVAEIAPRIAVNRQLFVDRPGARASFSWSIASAEKAWLEARGERLPVALNAALEVGVGLDAEDFRLVAYGRGGTTAARLSVIPRRLSGLDEESLIK
jgi:hypothetical protein